MADIAARRFGPLSFRPLTRRCGRAMTVLHIEMKPHSKAPPIHHSHTDEFFFVLSGSARGRIGRIERSFRAGDSVYLPAGTHHEFTAGAKGIRLLDVFVPGFDMRRPDIVICRSRKC